MKMLCVLDNQGYAVEYPSLGVLYLAGIAKDQGNEVQIFDTGLEKNKTLEQTISEFSPDLVFMGVYTPSILTDYKIIEKVKSFISKNAKIIVGGPHASAMPERTMNECKAIDFLIQGEAELSFAELIKVLANNEPVSSVKGIYWRENEKILHGPTAELLQNLDTLPFPAYDLIQKYEYKLPQISVGKKLALVITSRGCPYQCTFCHKGTFGAEYRRRTPENVVAELKWLFENFHYDEVYFVDDLFTLNKPWLYKFFELLDQEGLSFPWKCLGRVDSLVQEDYYEMKKHGCYLIQFGVESGNDVVLKDIKKKTNVATVRKAFEMCAKAGIQTYGFFSLGHRLDTKETVQETIKFAHSLKCDFLSFFVINPFPGTETFSYLTESPEKYDWSNYSFFTDSGNTKLSISSVEGKDLHEFASHAQKAYFSRASYLLRAMLSNAPMNIKKAKLRTWASYSLKPQTKQTLKKLFLIKNFSGS
ncbi:MAG: radical SAM protein [archaeon]|nr:radical SAM protein [archaeon]